MKREGGAHARTYAVNARVCCRIILMSPTLVSASKPCFRAMMSRNDTVPSSSHWCGWARGNMNVDVAL